MSSGVSESARLAHDLEELGGELVHHHAAVLAVGDLGHQARHRSAAELGAIETARFVVRLHLADELGVAALGLDDGDDAGAGSRGAATDEPVRQVSPLRPQAVVRLLDRVLLHQHPLVAAVAQRPDEFVGEVGVIRQRHLGRREAAHARQRLGAEECGEVVLPGLHVQAEVLHRRRGRDGVPPRCAEPFDGAAVVGMLREGAEGLEDVAQPHAVQPVQQRAGVLQHHARLLALFEELGDELPHALVAGEKGAGVVIVAHLRVLQHVLQVADDRRGAQVVAAGGDQRLMHVQRDGRGAAQTSEVDAALGQQRRSRPGALRLLDERFGAAEVGEPVDALREFVHSPPQGCRM